MGQVKRDAIMVWSGAAFLALWAGAKPHVLPMNGERALYVKITPATRALDGGVASRRIDDAQAVLLRGSTGPDMKSGFVGTMTRADGGEPGGSVTHSGKVQSNRWATVTAKKPSEKVKMPNLCAHPGNNSENNFSGFAVGTPPVEGFLAPKELEMTPGDGHDFLWLDSDAPADTRGSKGGRTSVRTLNDTDASKFHC